MVKKNPMNVRGAMSLWAALSVPVIMMLFFSLFFRVTTTYDAKRYLQNVGDLSSAAAAAEVIETSLLIPNGGTEPVPEINSVDAEARAREYLQDNFMTQQGLFATDVNSIMADVVSHPLILKPTNEPENPNAEGIAILVLDPVDAPPNPIGIPITSPSVLIIIQLRVNTATGTTMITTYSIANI